MADAAAAVAIVGAVVLLRRQPVALVAPAIVPGLSEFLAIAAARAAHASAVGAWLVRANDIVLLVAIGVFLALARRCAIGSLAAISAALTFAFSASFDPVLSPLQPAGVAVAAASYLALVRAGAAPGIRGGAIACAALVAAALVEPRMAPALALLAAWVVARSASASSTGPRWAAAGAAAAVVLLAVAALALVMPRLPPGLDAAGQPAWWSGAVARSWRDVRDAAWHVVTIAGPLAGALAALGAFARWSDARSRAAAPVLAFATVSVIVAAPLGPTASGDARWLAPALVGFWLLAAMGLDEFTRHVRRGVGAGTVAILLVVLLPLLRIARPPVPLPGDSVPRGHDRVTLDDFKRLAAALPDGAVVVRADAVGDLLLRALDGTWQRMGKSLRAETVESPRLPIAVTDGRTPVFALPAAQVRLPTLGFRMTDAGMAGVTGLARVQSVAACADVSPAWRELPALADTPSFALVSQARRWDGPLVLYAESGHRLDAGPHQWPGTTDRGFGGRTFARGNPADREALDQALRDDAFPAAGFSAGATDIVRLELWHPPEAPGVLVVDLSDRPRRVVARVGSASAPQSLTMCPVFAFEPRGF